MKKFIIYLMLTLCCITTSAQVIREGNTFKKIPQKIEMKTPFNWEDNNIVYPIYQNKKGKFYIKKISKKTGKEYRYYLPKEVQKELNKTINEIYEYKNNYNLCSH